MKSVLRIDAFEDRLTPSAAVDSAPEAYAWVLVNTLRQNPTAFANNLQGLVNGTVNAAFGLFKTDPVVTDLKGMIDRAAAPANYGASLSLMRATAPAGPLAWDDTLEARASSHNDWMRANGFAHTESDAPRSAIPGYSANDTAPPDTWGYSPGTYWSWGEDIGWAVGSLSATKAAYNSGAITLAGLLQRAAFLDTVGYMLELNSNSLGHLKNLLGRDGGTGGSLPTFNAIGMDIDSFEAPAAYEAQDGVPEAYISTHRFGLYRPNGSGGFVAGIAYQDTNVNGYFDPGEGSAVTVNIRDSAGNGVTDTLTAANFGAFSDFLPNGTYTVTATAAGAILASKTVTISNSNAWAELLVAGVGRPILTGPTGTPLTLRPAATWNTIDGATGYQVRIDDQAAGTTNIFPNSTTTGTNWSPPSDLVSGRGYRVYVRALRGTAPGPWAEPEDFIVGVPTKTGPTGTPTTLRPTLSWTGVAGATKYAVRIDDLSGQITNLFPNVTTTDASWAPPADLISGKTYAWTVRAVNTGGLGGWVPTGKFTVATPTPTAPANGVTALRPYFMWTPVAGTTAYAVTVNDVSAGKAGIFTAQVTGTTWAPPSDLVSGRIYSWQVRALNADGRGWWSPLATFTVGRAIPIGPGGDTAGPRPTFTWAGVTGAPQYQVRVNDLTTGQVSEFLPTVTDQSWTPGTDLKAGHTYRWWVRAVSNGGYGAWSVPKDFKVMV
jgi:hypothetical protein